MSGLLLELQSLASMQAGFLPETMAPSHGSRFAKNNNVEAQIYERSFLPFRYKSRFCLRISLYQACIFCSILVGYDWYESLKLFAYWSEAGFKTLIFMSHGDAKHKDINICGFFY
jgi:hypothetical protein